MDLWSQLLSSRLELQPYSKHCATLLAKPPRGLSQNFTKKYWNCKHVLVSKRFDMLWLGYLIEVLFSQRVTTPIGDCHWSNSFTVTEGLAIKTSMVLSLQNGCERMFQMDHRTSWSGHNSIQSKNLRTHEQNHQAKNLKSGTFFETISFCMLSAGQSSTKSGCW